MENIKSMADIKNISLLMGDEILTIHISIGSFQRVLMEILDIIKKYSVYLKEIYSYNGDTGKESYIRIIFYGQISPGVFEELDRISGIKKIDIISNENIELICRKCEVKICPKKISSKLSKSRKDI
ncbi:hypothetical protein [Picrophilus oshimae]|uniref:hypothetical protein n=1 Tax=Picrophilus oshimae TaxID=46632 RepID=UPI000A04217C|nr:hypothetical protein [Picrophilus oshimae]